MSFFEKLATWKEEYPIVKYIFLDFSDFPNLKISFPIGMVLIVACIAFCAATFALCRREAITTGIVRSLVRRGAKSEETAKSAEELRLDAREKKLLAARSGKTASYVHVAGEEKLTPEEYEALDLSKRAPAGIDLEAARFYIADEHREAAEKLAEADEPSVLKPIIISVAFVAAFAILFLVMPDLLEAINSWLAE